MNMLVKQQDIGRSIYKQAGKTTAYRSYVVFMNMLEKQQHILAADIEYCLPWIKIDTENIEKK